jgi:hypothetical protein
MRGVSPMQSDANIVLELGEHLADAVATLQGEAEELAARRPHPDAHLYDVEEGLRHRAVELSDWMDDHYYR